MEIQNSVNGKERIKKKRNKKRNKNKQGRFGSKNRLTKLANNIW